MHNFFDDQNSSKNIPSDLWRVYHYWGKENVQYITIKHERDYVKENFLRIKEQSGVVSSKVVQDMINEHVS